MEWATREVVPRPARWGQKRLLLLLLALGFAPGGPQIRNLKRSPWTHANGGLTFLLLLLLLLPFRVWLAGIQITQPRATCDDGLTLQPGDRLILIARARSLARSMA